MTSLGLLPLEVTDAGGRTITLTAQRLSEHFAITPGVVADTRTGELAYDGHSWDLQHLPTRQRLFRLGPTDEDTGECLTLDLNAVKTFAEWLEQQADWSIADPATLLYLPLSGEQRNTIAEYTSDPAGRMLPHAAAARGTS